LELSYIPDMHPHTHAIIEDYLPRAKRLVVDGEQRVRKQEARVAELERKGWAAPESRKLLKIMQETQALQVSHVRLLEREIKIWFCLARFPGEDLGEDHGCERGYALRTLCSLFDDGGRRT